LSSKALVDFMQERYARAISIDLGEWLNRNPPPTICEPKHDGFRVFLFKSRDKVLFTTRHGVIYSEASHPQLFKKILPLRKTGTVPDKLVLDAEYRGPDSLWIFDVLQTGNEDISGRGLLERKRILSEILSGDREFLLVRYEIANSFVEILEYKAKQLALGEEGIIVKNPSSTYGQKDSWLKLKRADTVDCFVTGIDRTIEMDRTGVPHSWFIGLYEADGSILEMGKVGTYLKEVDPSKITVGTVVEVQYQQVTEDKKFRGPFIRRIREDKKKEECSVSQLPPKILK
jgi:ATP-dependent DNA ligase